MRGRSGQRQLHRKQMRSAVQERPRQRHCIGGKSNAQCAVNAGRATLTGGIFGCANSLFSLRIKSGRPVTGGRWA